MPRTILTQYPSVRDDIADLVTRRPLPNRRLEQLDPFLFLNHHGPQVYPPHNRGLPFGPHPHRGFETVTFILEGSLLHRDTGGHESAIFAGGVQWMTAGRGLEHAEISTPEFLQQGGPLEILQLWVNLPSRLKMTDPGYTGLQKDDIPSIEKDGAMVHLVSGVYDGQTGPIRSLTDVHMMMVALRAGGRVTLPAPRERNVFLYVVRGNARIEGTLAREHHLIHLDDGADTVTIDSDGDAFLLFGHAEPLREPVATYGPFVMNTQEELVQAVRDYQAGKFA